MRLNVKKALVIVMVCLLLWLTFTYISFSHSPLGERPDYEDAAEKQMLDRLNLLEKELNNELLMNKNMLMDIEEKLVQAHKPHPTNKLNAPPVPASQKNVVLPVLVLACNRITVKRNLDQLIKYRPSVEQFPIIVSQDCNHEQTYEVIKSYASVPEYGLTLIQQPDLSDIPVPPKEKKFRGYFNIARHYRFALNYTFYSRGYDAAIIVEDDLDIAPDFFEYFLGTYPLLLNDPTLWCVSAWNDNGKPGLVDPDGVALLHRSDFFPGLGWMLRRNLWDELQIKWPSSYWDDWIRKPEQRLDRACIRPELPRTRTFGKVGVSNGLFFDKHLKLIQLSDKSVSFTKMNLTYLMKDNYDSVFLNAVYTAPEMSVETLKKEPESQDKAAVRIPFNNHLEYKRTVKALGLMDDFRSNFIRSCTKLEYCVAVWAPYQQKYKDSIEQIQKKFLRHLYMRKHGLYPTFMHHDELLRVSQYRSLDARRNSVLLLVGYKIINQLIDCPYLLQCFGLFAPPNYIRNRQHDLFYVPTCRTDVMAQHTLVRSIRLLNDAARDVDIFVCGLEQLRKYCDDKFVI